MVYNLKCTCDALFSILDNMGIAKSKLAGTVAAPVSPQEADKAKIRILEKKLPTWRTG